MMYLFQTEDGLVNILETIVGKLCYIIITYFTVLVMQGLLSSVSVCSYSEIMMIII